MNNNDPSTNANYDSHPILNPLYQSLKRLAPSYLGVVDVDVASTLLRQAWTEIAAEQIVQEHGRMVLSRVALATGERTTNIRRFQQGCLFNQNSPLNRLSKMIAAWAEDKKYRDSMTGKPARLLILGSGRTFERLVTATAGRGVTPQSALDELLAIKAVQVEREHWVRLIDTNWQRLQQYNSITTTCINELRRQCRITAG
ncbi:MAG: hypothetical protein Tsb002_11700 [Wenzhouxiangellaceae bacterium]